MNRLHPKFTIALAMILATRSAPVGANPVPCCQLGITETPLTFVFKIHTACWRDAGSPPDASQVKLFRDGQELTDTKWSAAGTERDVTFTTPVPWSPADGVHKFEVVAGDGAHAGCRGELTLGPAADGGTGSDAQVRDQGRTDRTMARDVPSAGMHDGTSPMCWLAVHSAARRVPDCHSPLAGQERITTTQEQPIKVGADALAAVRGPPFSRKDLATTRATSGPAWARHPVPGHPRSPRGGTERRAGRRGVTHEKGRQQAPDGRAAGRPAR